jgi:hypothetical protein
MKLQPITSAVMGSNIPFPYALKCSVCGVQATPTNDVNLYSVGGDQVAYCNVHVPDANGSSEVTKATHSVAIKTGTGVGKFYVVNKETGAKVSHGNYPTLEAAEKGLTYWETTDPSLKDKLEVKSE